MDIRRILLVDDDDDVRILVSRMLRKAGFDVETAPGGLEAVGLLKAGATPDLVILDHTMPVLDGIETLAMIRECHPGLPVLICSGRPDIQELPCFQHPDVAVLSKPFTLAEFMATVDRFRPSGP